MINTLCSEVVLPLSNEGRISAKATISEDIAQLTDWDSSTVGVIFVVSVLKFSENICGRWHI